MNPGRLFIAVFAASTAFPIVAALLPAGGVPSVLGIADVGLAAMVFVAAFLVEARSGKAVVQDDRAAAYRIIRAASIAIVALLLAFFVVPGAVNWSVLLIGLGWRAWIAIWALPSVIAALRA